MVKFCLLVWQCCEALAAAVSSTNVSPRCIVPGILFLESYFSCEDKSNWNWPKGIKIQIIGSLILQAVFRFPSVCLPLLPVFHSSLILSRYTFGCHKYKIQYRLQYSSYLVFLLPRNSYSHMLPVLHPWRLTMSLKQQKTQREHALLKLI